MFHFRFLFFFLKYELRVTASDNFKDNYTTVVINIRDVNDNSPIFEKTSYRTQITEEDDRGLPKRVLKVKNIKLYIIYDYNFEFIENKTLFFNFKYGFIIYSVLLYLHTRKTKTKFQC